MKIPGNSAFASIGKLYKIFNGRQKKVFIGLIFLTFLSSVADILGLSLVIPVVGLALNENFHQTLTSAVPAFSNLTRNQLLLGSVGTFFVLIIAKNAFGLYINKLQVNFVKNLFVSSSLNVLNKVYDKPLLAIQQKTSNAWVNKLTDMQIILCSNAAISTIIIINETIVFTLTAVIVCFWNWELFLLLVGVLIPSIGFFYSRVKKMIRNAGQQKNKSFTYLYGKAQEMILGYTDIKIAGTERNFKKRFRDIAKNFSLFQGKVDFTFFIPARIIEIAIFLCIIVILLYGVYVIKDVQQIVTTITLFAMIAYRSIPSVNRFVVAMNNLSATEFVFEDEDFLPEERRDRAEDPEPMVFKDKIQFKDVSFSYGLNAKSIIKGCNLEIRKGETIGIIGKSGAGKSTVVNNVLGFLQPTSGHILIDGKELSPANVKSWWKVIGYVRQDVFIRNATLLENIAIGVPVDRIDMDRIERAIRLSSLTDLVKDIPEGLDSKLSERGTNLSGGQKQRIAIARAIYKGAEVLIFDEATSALDAKTEDEITTSIQELGRENLTILIIAHRYSSLKYCNKIYSLEAGELKAPLSYSELIELQ